MPIAKRQAWRDILSVREALRISSSDGSSVV
jgi:hypothetical protein